MGWSLGVLLALAGTAHGEDGALRLRDSASLDDIELAAWRYVIEQRDARSELSYNTTEPGAPASPTACGVALSAIPIAVERGWVTQAEGYRLAERWLRGISRAEQVRGLFYHFLDPQTGARTWQSEVSAIDSAILFAGALIVAEYFTGTPVARRAEALVARAQWPWFLNGTSALQWGWRPESGFEGGAMEFSEGILAYLLALGSATHPIAPETWRALTRPMSRVGRPSKTLVYTSDGSLFAYLLPLAWFDLRDRHDAVMDYWTNAGRAILANQRFCRLHGEQSRTYAAGLWGVSAALGPDGYRAYGASPAHHLVQDGTVAPYVVAASLPWFPDVARDALRRMEALAPTLWTRYGYGDAVNLERGFVCRETIALDQGLALLMIENARSGLLWTLMMRHPVARRALRAAGFVSGSLEEPLVDVLPGNPDAVLEVHRLSHPVVVDGDLQEWGAEEPFELTPTHQRHVEFGVIRDGADASALLYAGWTPERFYLAGLVRDDDVVTQHPGKELFRDDCVEVYFDLDGDGFRFDGNPADVQIGVAPPAHPEEPWQRWAWGALDRWPSDVEVAGRRQPGGYRVELSLPWTMAPLPPGAATRFSVAIHDQDADGSEGKLHWSVDTASVPGTLLFGHLVLRDDPVMAPRPSVE